MPKKSSKKNEAKSTIPAAASIERALIKTNYGEMTVEFWPEVAPKTVENLKKLAREKFYDGTCFHRIVAGFMIQGGDPLTKDEKNADSFGTGGPGYQIDAEFNERHHEKGVLSMARSSDPDSAGSQFFICLNDAGFLDRQYTAFGKLVAGEDVLTSIGKVPTTYSPMGNEKSQPISRVAVETITLVGAK
jgi:peptidyl-prolyl cis-trans isomerase B (cyclophilin B)